MLSDIVDKSYVDITNALMPNGIFHKDIVLYAKSKEEAEFINKHTKLKKRICKFLNGYFDALQKEQIRIQNALFSPEDVLEYFKTHKNDAKAFKKILDVELEHIKTHRRDIVESWKYYQEFLKMC